MPEEDYPALTDSSGRGIKKFVLVKDQGKKAHDKIVYDKYKLYPERHGHIAKIKDKEKKIEKGMQKSDIEDLLSDEVVFGRRGIGDHDAETEGNECTPRKDTGHKLLGVTGLLYVYHEHTYGQYEKCSIIYNKKRIIHIRPHINKS
jgi:hypothetical protein